MLFVVVRVEEVGKERDDVEEGKVWEGLLSKQKVPKKKPLKNEFKGMSTVYIYIYIVFLTCLHALTHKNINSRTLTLTGTSNSLHKNSPFLPKIYCSEFLVNNVFLF